MVVEIEGVEFDLVGEWKATGFQQFVGFPPVERCPAMNRFIQFSKEHELKHLEGVRVVMTREPGSDDVYWVSDPTWVIQDQRYQGLVWALSKRKRCLGEALESATARLTEFTLLDPIETGKPQSAAVKQAAMVMNDLLGDLVEEGTRLQVPYLRSDGKFAVRRFWRNSL